MLEVGFSGTLCACCKENSEDLIAPYYLMALTYNGSFIQWDIKALTLLLCNAILEVCVSVQHFKLGLISFLIILAYILPSVWSSISVLEYFAVVIISIAWWSPVAPPIEYNWHFSLKHLLKINISLTTLCIIDSELGSLVLAEYKEEHATTLTGTVKW